MVTATREKQESTTVRPRLFARFYNGDNFFKLLFLIVCLQLIKLVCRKVVSQLSGSGETILMGDWCSGARKKSNKKTVMEQKSKGKYSKVNDSTEKTSNYSRWSTSSTMIFFLFYFIYLYPSHVYVKIKLLWPF